MGGLNGYYLLYGGNEVDVTKDIGSKIFQASAPRACRGVTEARKIFVLKTYNVDFALDGGSTEGDFLIPAHKIIQAFARLDQVGLPPIQPEDGALSCAVVVARHARLICTRDGHSE